MLFVLLPSIVFGSSQWQTKRTLGLSIPIPNAIVATITSIGFSGSCFPVDDEDEEDVPPTDFVVVAAVTTFTPWPHHRPWTSARCLGVMPE